MAKHTTLTDLAADLHAEVERIWPTPDGTDLAERQALALCEEVGEIARAILKRSHARRSPDGTHKGQDADSWSYDLADEIAQAIGVALQLAHIEGMSIDMHMRGVLDDLRNRRSILDGPGN